MHVNVDIIAAYTNEDINLNALFELPHVLDEGSMIHALKLAVAEVAIRHNVSFEEIDPDYFEGDDSGNELNINAQVGMTWVEQMGKLVWHLLNAPYNDEGVYLAYIDNSGWKWTDFDELKNIDDEFREEFDGDHAEYAREHMSGCGESIPEHMESHFDFESYGEEILEGYSVCEWAGQSYVFDSE